MINNPLSLKQKFSSFLARKEEGFTIIELMIALSILMIILFAFTPLLVGSIERIGYAGDKSEALYQSQADLETNISLRETIDGYEVTFTFGDEEDQTIITVPGGFIDSPQVQGNAEAWLSTFIPYVPFITLSNPFLPEGYNGDGSANTLLTYIMGMETSLVDASFVEIYTREEYEASESNTYNLAFTYLGTTPPYGLPPNYNEYAEFLLPAKSDGFTNAHSPYIVQLDWIANNISVKVRTRLHIILPDAVAVGESSTILVSPDAVETWNIRNNDTALAVDINDIIWSNFRFIAITNSGKALIWGNEEEPTLINTPASLSLNSLVYGNGKIVAVGNEGIIIVSADGGQTWTDIVTETTANLLAVSFSGSEFLAVGSNGTYLRSTDANTWELNQIALSEEWPSISLSGVAYGNGAWIIAGDRKPTDVSNPRRSVIFKEESTNSWTVVYSTDNNSTWLNDITYDIIDLETGAGQFLAIGNSGQALTSSDGSSWSVANIGSSELNAVIWDNYRDIPQYIIVGNNGTVVTGTPGSWTTRTTGVSAKLKGVTIRWEN